MDTPDRDEQTWMPGQGLLTPGAGTHARERLQQASDRAAYLSQVARGLSGALQTDRAVELVLEMLVGPVVDWAQVTLTDRRQMTFRARSLDGRVTTSTVAAAELDPGSSLARTLTTGLTDLLMVPDGDDADSSALASAVPAAEQRGSLVSIRPMDMLTIALSARGTTYGALTIAQRAGIGFDTDAVAFLEDFAHRVAVTLDTARALAESRRVAAVLSRVEAVRETGTPVVVGGCAYDAAGRRARVIGATAFATSASGVAELVASLPTAVPPAPPLTHPGADEAFVVFGDREAMADEVAGAVLDAVSPHDPGWVRVLEDQLPHLVGSIAGALVTDDPSVVRHALVWADIVLASRRAPEGTGAAIRRALADVVHELPVASRLLDAGEPV